MNDSLIFLALLPFPSMFIITNFFFTNNSSFKKKKGFSYKILYDEHRGGIYQNPKH